MEKADRFLLKVGVIGGIFIIDIVVRGYVRPIFPLKMPVEVEVQQRRVPLCTHSMMSVLAE